jgi:phosphoglucosamine mutase
MAGDLSKKYFGTDGVRGRVGEPPITPELILRLGHAAGRVFAAQSADRPSETPAVLIGKDTRISGYLMEAALESGLSAAGVDVYLSGPLPTPAVAYLTRALRLSAGIVISASHNPFEDNGIKFFSAAGTKLPDAVEQAIERAMDEPVTCAPSRDLGKAFRVNDAAGRYIEFCKSTFPNELDLKGLRIVVDCAHGAGYHVAPPVFHELGAEVIAVGNEPDGLNINASVGATHPRYLQAAVLEHRADYGIALDGDGDRLVMVDAAGRIYDGDQLLYIIAADRQARGELAVGIAGTLMSNLGFEQALGRLNIPFARAAVGDRYVLELLLERNWVLGGENSGHILCLDKHSTGDAIISALQVLMVMRRTGRSLPELTADCVLYPQRMINVRTERRIDWRTRPEIVRVKDAVETELAGHGRVLLRPSGTEPVLRVMVEAQDADQADRQVRQLAAAVKASALSDNN